MVTDMETTGKTWQQKEERQRGLKDFIYNLPHTWNISNDVTYMEDITRISNMNTAMDVLRYI